MLSNHQCIVVSVTFSNNSSLYYPVLHLWIEFVFYIAIISIIRHWIQKRSQPFDLISRNEGVIDITRSVNYMSIGYLVIVPKPYFCSGLLRLLHLTFWLPLSIKGYMPIFPYIINILCLEAVNHIVFLLTKLQLTWNCNYNQKSDRLSLYRFDDERKQWCSDSSMWIQITATYFLVIWSTKTIFAKTRIEKEL